MTFRAYDPALGRFTGVDLLAELQYEHTPYHFGYGNPNVFADPSGLFPDGNGRRVGERHSDSDGEWEWDGTMWVGLNGTVSILMEVVIAPDDNGAGSGAGSEDGAGSSFGFGGEPSAWDLLNGATGTYLTLLEKQATYNSQYVYKYGSKAVSASALTAANTARMLNIAKNVQLLGSGLGLVAGIISLSNAYTEYQTTGVVNYKAITDGTVSIAGSTASSILMLGLVSNPIGLTVLGGIAVGAAIYGVVSFGIDVYNANN